MIKTNFFACPNCTSELFQTKDALLCKKCAKSFPIKNGKVFFAVPPADMAINATHHPEDQKQWTSLRRAQHAFVAGALSGLASNTLICDLGAGPGQSQEIFNKFSNYVGVDIYPYPKISVIADIEKRIPFKNESFDAVVGLSTLEHIHDVKSALGEIFRILKPEGKLVGVVPFLLGIHQAPYDFHRFTRFELKKLLDEAGLKNIQIVSLATPYDWYWTSQLHFFMKLLDAARATSYWKFILAKIIWNLQKYLTKFLRPVFLINQDEANPLGYGFTAHKP